jgi:hypothetical protein
LENKMENPFPEIPAEDAGLLTLGVALGENVAFGLVSGRTAAAQASCLQRLREEKLFQALEPTWEQFCPKYLKMSRAEADRTIRLYQEFGSGYFEMAQLTRISAETYRAVAPAVKDGALHVDGEAIELNPQNSHKVAAAVAQLRRAIPGRTASHKTNPIEDLHRLSTAILQEFQKAARRERDGENWPQFAATLERLRADLASIAAESGIDGDQQNWLTRRSISVEVSPRAGDSHMNT